MFTYKTVQLPKTIQVTAKNRDTAAADMLQNVINQYSQQGWEFYRVDTVTTVQPPGCLGAFTGQREVYETLNVVIFRKP